MKLATVSASQVEAYRRCPRYWYNRSILKIPEPTSPAQARGKLIHSVIEEYLKTGQIEVEGNDTERIEAIEIARAGLENLPPPSPGLLIEEYIEIPTYADGPLWIGYIDLCDVDQFYIGDHKTTSDFRYVKTPNQLVENTQMSSYAWWLFQLKESANEVKIEHLYFRTKRPYKGLVVQATLTREQCAANWNRDLLLVEEMESWANQDLTSANDLEPNTQSCDMYGGCTYRKQCGFDGPFNGLEWKMNESGENGKVVVRRRIIPSMLPVLPVVEVAPIITIEPAAPIEQIPSIEQVTLVAEEVLILPPDAPSRDEKVTAEQVSVMSSIQPKRRGRPRKNPAPEASLFTAAMHKVDLPISPVVIPEVILSQIEEKIEQHVPTVAEVPKETVTIQTPASDIPREERPALRQLTLIIDGFITKGAQCTYASDWLAPIVEEINRVHGIDDPRLMDYGKGPALVAHEIRKRIKDLPPVLVIDGAAPFAKEIIAALTPYAQTIFKGMR